MSRNLMLCVLVACVSAGCVVTRGGGTTPGPGTGTGPETEAPMCPTRPAPRPPPLPAATLMSTLERIPEGVTHLIVAYCPETQHVEAVGVDVRANTLPFRIKATREQVPRFFDAAYRSGLPMAVFTRNVPLEAPLLPGTGSSTSLKGTGTATASLIPEGGTGDEPQTSTCDVCPGGQTGTGTGLGGTNGGADPGWLFRVFPDVAIRTAKAMETALKTRAVEFNEAAQTQ